ncbi:MAG: glycoside hydrolase family 2 TIM barrel-domain containing protein, partial [Ornithinimicrobium sp.]
GLHAVVWYARVFDPVELGDSGDRLILRFGAVDRYATVWVNGSVVAQHEGGYTPFSADITQEVAEGPNVLVVRVSDPVAELDQPRGKQYWMEHADDVFYQGATGIWQTVWLEPVARAAIEDLLIVPMLDDASVEITASVTAAAIGKQLVVRIAFADHLIVHDSMLITGVEVRRRWDLTEGAHYADATIIDHRGVATWSPDHPRLHDVHIEVVDDGQMIDAVDSYFGLRKIEARGGQVMLNNRPLYQRLVLDQGYFPEGGYTAPNDEALRRDIELAKEMGFNGARKHQKAEDPRWLYWADRLGFVVWAEMPSGFRYSIGYVNRVTTQWQEIIARDRNHPCIIVWTPVNESWGVPALRGAPDQRQVSFLKAMYHLTKSLDPTRLVVSNDGWEHAETDLCTIHHYGDEAKLRATFTDRQTAVRARPLHRAVYVPGCEHGGEPIIVSEFGGVALQAAANESDDSVPTWGFHTVLDGPALLERYRGFVEAATDSGVVVGFCWTQLTDIQQEANGLLTKDRTPKVDVAAIREVNEQIRPRRLT